MDLHLKINHYVINIFFICLDSCSAKRCVVPGEKCLEGKCICGGKEACEQYVITGSSQFLKYIRGDLTCDPSSKEGFCKCKDLRNSVSTICTKEKKFCTMQGCKCSRLLNEYSGGDDISQGTCQLASDKCLNITGDCDGKLILKLLNRQETI